MYVNRTKSQVPARARWYRCRMGRSPGPGTQLRSLLLPIPMNHSRATSHQAVHKDSAQERSCHCISCTACDREGYNVTVYAGPSGVPGPAAGRQCPPRPGVGLSGVCSAAPPQ